MNQHRPRLLHFLLYSLLLYILLPTGPSSAGSVRASPIIQPTAAVGAAGAEPVEFLRNLPGLAGLTEDADHFISGGGFLYWAKCQPDGPNRQQTADSAGSTGYLRRWPLGGGLPLLLSPLAFCETDLWAADESGLYYWQNGALYRRSAAAPLTPVIVTTTARPASNLVLNEQLLYWVVGGTLWQVPKGQSWVAGGRDETEAMAETGALFSNLIVSGSQIYWSADGQIRAVDKSCIVQCTVSTLVNEAGFHLADARATGPTIGTTINPHWVAGPYDFYQGFQFTGRAIRGYQCTASPLGNSCAAATLYTAPDRSDSTGTLLPPTLGALSSDGQFLFWIENLKNCVNTPFGRTCSDSDAGRLMKWRLQRTVLNNDPFLTPQPIASKNSGGTFSIRGTGEVQSAGGWLYFLTSNGLSRLRADAAPLQWDLAYQAMEVTQGIQNLANQVPLVANKPTVVRVYQRKLSGPNLYGVRARLHYNRPMGHWR
jgi:hypothetical protein